MKDGKLIYLSLGQDKKTVLRYHNKVWQMKEPTVEAVFGVDAGIIWEALN